MQGMKHELAAFEEVISSCAYFLPSYDARSATLLVASLRREACSAIVHAYIYAY